MSFRGLIAAAVVVVATPALSQSGETTIAGAGPGSLAYNMAAALAENVNRADAGMRATAESSSGFVENARLVGRGETDFGITSGVQVFEALTSAGPYEGEPGYSDLRGVAITHGSSASIVAVEGIEEMADLEGKRLSLGPPGSLLGYTGELMLKVYGLEGKVETVRMSVSESSRALVDGTIDAFVAGPAPYPAVLEASAQRDLNVVPVDVEHIKMIQETAPVVVSTMPAGVYDWLEEDVTIVGFLAYVVANKNVPDETVTALLEANLSETGVAYLKNNHSAWSIWDTPAYITDSNAFAAEGMKMHPGAAAYWSANGVELPEAILD